MVYIRWGNLYLPDTVHMSPFPPVLYIHRPVWKSPRASRAVKPALPPTVSSRIPRLRTAGSIKSIQPLRCKCTLVVFMHRFISQLSLSIDFPVLERDPPSYSLAVFRPYLDAIYAFCCNGHEGRGHVYSTVFILSAWLTEGVHSILAEWTKE